VDAVLDQQAAEIQTIFPQYSVGRIRRDLERTGNQNLTLERLLDGRVGDD
jgi:hypothetical protein